jgi:hypothetical protein
MPPMNGNLHMDLAEPYKKARPNTKQGLRAFFEEERLIDLLYQETRFFVQFYVFLLPAKIDYCVYPGSWQRNIPQNGSHRKPMSK